MAVRWFQKLCRHGNSTAVSIPRPLLFHLGWVSGEWLVIEPLEDDSVRLRRPVQRDFEAHAPRHVFHVDPPEVKA